MTEPKWDSHGWPAVTQDQDGHWYGVAEDYLPTVGDTWKGPQLWLRRDQGQYICTTTASCPWTPGVLRRPPPIDPLQAAEEACARAGYPGLPPADVIDTLHTRLSTDRLLDALYGRDIRISFSRHTGVRINGGRGFATLYDALADAVGLS